MTHATAQFVGRRCIRVLIVDDSAVVRKILTRELARDPGIEVVGTAVDPYDARDKIAALEPDLLTLDLEMPRMDGITFLRKLMEYHPLPVIVISSLTEAGRQTAVEALDCGAVNVVAKPGSAYTVNTLGEPLIAMVKQAARARVFRTATGDLPWPASPAASKPAALTVTTDKVLALGASTGGVQALTALLTQFPADAPGTLVVQHMPPKFTQSFARRLDAECQVEVKEAEDGDSVYPGRVLIAPGGLHMVLRRSGARYLVQTLDGPPVQHQKPSVDVLFNSVAACGGVNAVAAILTGMGADGADGLLAIRRAGGRTIAQDQTTCVVFGMPMEAIRLGGVEKVLPLPDITRQLLRFASERPDHPL
jgi:two-component system chemotaxis response regulator CheB